MVKNLEENSWGSITTPGPEKYSVPQCQGKEWFQGSERAEAAAGSGSVYLGKGFV